METSLQLVMSKIHLYRTTYSAYSRLTNSISAESLSQCFATAGSPSGHAMGAAGVYYAMVTSILTIMLTNKKTSSKTDL